MSFDDSKFSQQLSTYNVQATNYRRTRAACARAKNSAGGVKVAIYGHSVVNNTGATSVAKGWPARLKALMQTAFGDAGDGVVTLLTGNDYGPNMSGGYGALTSVTLTATADQFTYWVARDGSGGTSTVSIDGAAQTTVNHSGSNAWLPTSYSVTQASHTLTFASTGFPTQAGMQVRRNGGIGAQVWSFGVNGQTISQMTANAHPPTGSLPSYAVVGSPDLVIIECMGNDFKASTAVATYQATLDSLVSAIKTPGVDVLLVADYQFDPAQQTGTQIPNSTYVAAVRAVCDKYNIGMVDLNYKWGSYAIAQASPVSYMNDAFHPNDAGHQDIASSVYQAIQSLGVGA